MPKTDCVYIAAHRRDLRFLRICVAAVRQWYPDLPIRVLVDAEQGRCSLAELESVWGVSPAVLPQSCYGWGFAKLEPHFMERPHRYLVLDSDAILIGPVLERVDAMPEPFVVDEESQSEEELRRLYFDVNRIRGFDPAFRYAGFVFNTGQLVGTACVLARSDFDLVVDWGVGVPQLRHTDAFMRGEQGVLNYVVNRRVSEGSLAVARVPFMRWPKFGMDDISLDVIKNEGYPLVVHWAGLKRACLGDMIRGDILRYFEHRYYRSVPGGFPLLWLRILAERAEEFKLSLKRRVRGETA